MKIPLSWLKQYIDAELSAAQIAKLLTNAGLEVDAVEKITPGFEGVVVGRVESVEKHPGADSLSLATVTDGEHTYHLVCGASNCRPGIKTAFARIGANLSDEQGKPFKIKKAKIRGVESSGMLCSFAELGLPGESEGIVEFAEHIKEGTDVADLYGETVLEISLTPNLGHCQSILGVARELSAATGALMRYPLVNVKESQDPIEKFVSVEVKDPQACPRYMCRLVKGVTVGPSPEWLKTRLEACGIRSINNVVDVTNYVLLERGHPLHSFDFGHIAKGKIVVRTSEKGERFVTLDGKERELEESDLLICDASSCDASSPVALAGVMGGSNSEVGLNTKDVLLEAAYFAPGVIRKTSKRLGLFTDASKRFERGTDPNGLLQALDRAAMLIEEVAGGTICQGVIDVAAKAFPEKQITCRLSRINSLLGTHLSVNEVETIFKRLDFKCHWDGKDVFSLKVPTYRNDVQEEIDLIEEVARVYGYDNIKKTETRFTSTLLPHAPIFLFERQVRSQLVAEGLQEFLTCDLIGPSLLGIVKGPQEELPKEALSKESEVKVLNPTSIEQSILRTSLLPNLLQVVKYNWDHQNHHLAGFEVGRIHFKEGEQYKEQSVAGIVLFGEQSQSHWDVKPRECDFYDLKGIVENVLSELRINKVSFEKSHLPSLHPGRQASIYAGKIKVGTFGEVHPAIVKRLDVPQRIFYAELNLHDLFQQRQTKQSMQDLPLYPGSVRDWTLTLQETLPIDHVLRAINHTRSSLLEQVSVVGIYRSDKLGQGLKNVTLRFFYRDQKKTLSQEAVENEHSRIITNVQDAIKNEKPIN